MRIELAVGAALASLKPFREENFWQKPKWPLLAIAIWVLICLALIGWRLYVIEARCSPGGGYVCGHS